MKISKLFHLALLLSAIVLFSCGKDEETMTTPPTTPISGLRYVDSVFSELIEHKEVVYGESTKQDGSKIQLSMNIYEPANDTEARRPLIVLAHGGGFTTGAKEDFDDLAKSFAHSGYVATTISYRLSTTDFDLKIAVIDALHDMRAAIRFFTKDNQYRIDPSNVFAGGFSAGAVTALHLAYVSDSEIDLFGAELADYIRANGGLTGNSGNPGASDQIKGVINIAGGLFKASLVSPGEPILYSAHGDADVDVYCTVDPEAATNPDGDFTEGSCLIHPQADAAGITNKLKLIVGGDHGAFFEGCTCCRKEVREFVQANL